MPLFIFLAVVIVAYFVYILYLKETKRTQELKRTLDTDNFEKIIEQVKKVSAETKTNRCPLPLREVIFIPTSRRRFSCRRKTLLLLHEKKHRRQKQGFSVGIDGNRVVVCGRKPVKGGRFLEKVFFMKSKLIEWRPKIMWWTYTLCAK